MKQKKYFYDYEDFADGKKNAKTMAEEILNDPELATLNGIIIGNWGEAYAKPCREILQMFAENSSEFAHIESLFIGDMTSEESEVSWIQQNDYSMLWVALPNLKHLTIKGSNNLKLGKIIHQNLLSLEIICGGLPKSVIHSVVKAELPKLEKLNLYIGVENYGFDGGIEDIEMIVKTSFPSLKYLGLGNSDMQNKITELVMTSPLLPQLEVLDLSNGTLTDRGAKVILNNIEKLKHLKLLDLHHHYLTDEMMDEIKKMPIKVDLDCEHGEYYDYNDEEEDEEEDEDYEDEIYPMLTE